MSPTFTKIMTNTYISDSSAGDIIKYEGQPCRVIRVNESAAVVAVSRTRPPFTTAFSARPSRIPAQPHAGHRISPNSEIAILNR